VIDHAMASAWWVVSPTTLMAVLNTALAVLNDVGNAPLAHVIKTSSESGWNSPGSMRVIASSRPHPPAHEDAEKVHVSSVKITQRFSADQEVEF